jgi:stage III sporulation protein SpoIIIAA
MPYKSPILCGSMNPCSLVAVQVIVDTSNEIGGDGDVPHPAIGGARRMQVPDPSQQHRVMVMISSQPVHDAHLIDSPALLH